MSRTGAGGFLPSLQDVVYQPWTNWEGFCRGWFSPNITFGSNTQDRAVEAHVLESVGSYGKQLGCIIESISVLISRSHYEDLTPAEEHAISEFRKLARNARAAVGEFRGGAAHEDATLAAVDAWINAIAALRETNRAAYTRLSTRIKDALPPLENKE